ncbi:MAG: asparagine synthase-related protein [Anaerolineae bacterium]
MSAFFGIVNFDGEPVDEALARRMLDWIAYLGPDAQALWVDGSVALGHALFQTTFESAREAQPLTVDGVTIVADARLVARDDLLRELRSAGCALETTATDVDLILNAYSVWGEDCLLHLQGDFVFAIWDMHRKRLFAGRDHFGNYILYYARVGGTLVFSTEIMAVLQHPAVPRTINERSIGDFLLFGEQWLESSWTAYAQVFRLHRAYRLVATADRTINERYWNLATDQPELRYKTEDEYVEHFLSVMSQAVKERIRTDRVFISLSGGLDSSAIAAIAVDLVKRGEINAEISAYTMAYDRIHGDNDEPYYAGLVAQALDIPIRFFSCDPYGFTAPLTMIAPEPLTVLQSGMHAVSSRQSGEQGRVYLTGVSGDEVLHESLLTESLSGMSVGGAVEEYLWLWRFTGKRPLAARLAAVSHPAAPEAGQEAHV